MVKRTTDEIIVLTLCSLCAMGLGLFTVIRLQRGEVDIAVVDGIGLVISAAIFAYVYRTQDLRVAAPLLAILSLTGTVVLVVLVGPDERYLLYPTSVGAYFLMRPAWAMVASVVALAGTSAVILPVVDVFVYGKFLLSISGCVLFAYVFARERNIQRDELLSLSTLDPLTGVGNRRAFDEQLRELLRMRNRAPTPASLLLLDLDHFKEVNDSRGHDAGDRLLREIAALIDARMRAGDHAFRFGGDEFAVLALGEGVQNLGQDLCDRIAALSKARSLPVTVSVGIATLEAADVAEDLIKRADTALYEAKDTGRNTVSIAGASLAASKDDITDS